MIHNRPMICFYYHKPIQNEDEVIELIESLAETNSKYQYPISVEAISRIGILHKKGCFEKI